MPFIGGIMSSNFLVGAYVVLGALERGTLGHCINQPAAGSYRRDTPESKNSSRLSGNRMPPVSARIQI